MKRLAGRRRNAIGPGLESAGDDHSQPIVEFVEGVGKRVGAVRVPSARRRTAAPAQLRRHKRPELVDPSAHRLAADLDPALCQQFFHIADAQGEPEIQPDRLPDHVRREPMALERNPAVESSPPKPAPGRLSGDVLPFA